jgi:hypothetical protein
MSCRALVTQNTISRNIFQLRARTNTGCDPMSTYTDTIVIAKDFAEAPGARYIADGPKSGEEFLRDMLEPRFLAVVESGGILMVDLDGTWGYASSFISGAFGELARKHGTTTVNKHLAIKSDEDSILLEKVRAEINQESKVA